MLSKLVIESMGVCVVCMTVVASDNYITEPAYIGLTPQSHEQIQYVTNLS